MGPATRYEKQVVNYLAMVAIAAILICGAYANMPWQHTWQQTMYTTPAISIMKRAHFKSKTLLIMLGEKDAIQRIIWGVQGEIDDDAIR